MPLRVLLMILWESKSLDDKKYIALSVKLDEIGRNLGGWMRSIDKTKLSHKSRRSEDRAVRERNEEICETAKADPLLRFHLLSGCRRTCSTTDLIIAVRVEEVRIAIRNVHNAIHATTPRSFARSQS